MKRFLFVLVLLVLVILSVGYIIKQKVAYDLAQPIIQSVMSPTPTMIVDKNAQVKTSVFVPYWTTGEEGNGEQFDQYLYFGITPDTNGIAEDSGKTSLDSFFATVPDGKDTYLVLRMVDSEINTRVLKDKKLQQRVINQTVSIAKENGFSGVVLDLELNALPFESIISQITSFTKALSKETHTKDMQFQMAMYGDTFYRVRPFEVKTLAQDVDKMLVMAYDFHKSRGNPGPNFPLKGKEQYGYDYEKLTTDYLGAMPADKISVVFGLFGYDWEVDANNKAVSYGKPLTYKQIQETFLNSCDYSDCVITRDPLSTETKITYRDEENLKHIVWFEDPTSAKQKQAYLKSRGISNFSYWAYSYY